MTSARSGAWRSRWAAVGAAVAVTLGAGGMIAVDAASSDPSSTVTVEPTRILDTRTDVGLAGPFVSGVSQKLQVTGTVPTQPPGGVPAVDAEVVPATATAVILNATVVKPSTKGFLSIRPGDATGNPATSNINWAAGGANIANSITVQLPASGQIDVFVNGSVGDVLIDVAGYMIPATGGTPGPKGDTGDKGDQGDPGPGLTTKSAVFSWNYVPLAAGVWQTLPPASAGSPAACDAGQVALAVYPSSAIVIVDAATTRLLPNVLGATATRIVPSIVNSAPQPAPLTETVVTVCGELPTP